MGMLGAVELQPIDGEPTKRALEVFGLCFDNGVIVRTTGDIIALTPPLIIEESEIQQIVETLGQALRELT